MSRALIALGVVAAFVGAWIAWVSFETVGSLDLISVKLELPESDKTFEGPGSDTVSNHCLACHSEAMILNQPPLSRAAWEGAIKKMISVYKAPIPESEAGAIVDYLTTLSGAKE